MSRGSLYRSVQGLKTRRTSSNCWISFFKVSLSLFMWINIVDGITFLFWNFFLDPKVQSSKKHLSQYMRYVKWFPCLNLVCHIAYLLNLLKISGLHIVCKGKPSILELSASLARFWIQVLIWPESWMCLTFVKSLKTSLFCYKSNFRTMKQPSPQCFFNIFRF